MQYILLSNQAIWSYHFQKQFHTYELLAFNWQFLKTSQLKATNFTGQKQIPKESSYFTEESSNQVILQMKKSSIRHDIKPTEISFSRQRKEPLQTPKLVKLIKSGR